MIIMIMPDQVINWKNGHILPRGVLSRWGVVSHSLVPVHWDRSGIYETNRLVLFTFHPVMPVMPILLFYELLVVLLHHTYGWYSHHSYRIRWYSHHEYVSIKKSIKISIVFKNGDIPIMQQCNAVFGSRRPGLHTSCACLPKPAWWERL